MSENSRINKQSSALAEEAADRAIARKRAADIARIGGDGKDAEDVQVFPAGSAPTDFEPRQKAKKALHG